MYGKFITVEGLDGSGKTTIIPYIIKNLNRHGIVKILTVREPGGTPISDILRILIKHKLGNEFMHDVSELLMIYAARIQLLEEIIKPALLKNYWVIGDRYDLSSQAYQGGGRGVNALLLNTLSKVVTENLSPDLTLYLDIDPIVAFSRIKNRESSLDRIERESLSFFNRVRSCYKKLVILKKNIVTINTNEPLEKVIMMINDSLNQWYSRCLR